MIIGLGSDLCNIERIQNSLDRFGDRFVQRVFTDVEQAKAERRPFTKAGTLAKRFAAKEAVAKAMGAPPGMMWHHCWIPRPDHGDGRPTVHLTGTVQAQAEALGITHWHLSLSHDGDVATAYVVAERRAAEEESA